MARIRKLDENTAERLLSGALQPDDVPPGYAGVAHLLDAARPTTVPSSPPTALLAALAEGAANSTTPRRKSMLAQLFSAKVATLAVGALAVSATGAAAATGNLPPAAQDRVAAVADHVGLELPTSASQTAKDVHDVLSDDSLTGKDKGKAVSDAAKGDHATTGDDKSADAKQTAEDKKADAEDKADAGKANAANHPSAPTGTPADAPVATPNDGGTTTADDSSATGTDTAGAETDAPAQGSANADSHRP